MEIQGVTTLDGIIRQNLSESVILEQKFEWNEQDMQMYEERVSSLGMTLLSHLTRGCPKNSVLSQLRWTLVKQILEVVS